MSIVLKLSLETALLYLRSDPNSPYAQATVAAHAMQIAIEEGMEINPTVTWWIRERAAAHLARLMGEGH